MKPLKLLMPAVFAAILSSSIGYADVPMIEIQQVKPPASRLDNNGVSASTIVTDNDWRIIVDVEFFGFEQETSDGSRHRLFEVRGAIGYSPETESLNYAEIQVTPYKNIIPIEDGTFAAQLFDSKFTRDLPLGIEKYARVTLVGISQKQRSAFTDTVEAYFNTAVNFIGFSLSSYNDGNQQIPHQPGMVFVAAKINAGLRFHLSPSKKIDLNLFNIDGEAGNVITGKIWSELALVIGDASKSEALYRFFLQGGYNYFQIKKEGEENAVHQSTFFAQVGFQLLFN